MKWLFDEIISLRMKNSALEQENRTLLTLKNELEVLRAETVALKALAYRDEVTGLWNRRYFNERLDEEMNRVHRHPNRELSILIIDIDNFKKINDMLGHDVGDEMLRWASETLLSHLRGCDICCRWGGDEFAIILPDTGSFGVTRVIERLKEACSKTQLPSHLPRITISIGCATWPHCGSSASVLLKMADAAMYHDKYQQKSQLIRDFDQEAAHSSAHFGHH